MRTGTSAQQAVDGHRCARDQAGLPAGGVAVDGRTSAPASRDANGRIMPPRPVIRRCDSTCRGAATAVGARGRARLQAWTAVVTAVARWIRANRGRGARRPTRRDPAVSTGRRRRRDRRAHPLGLSARGRKPVREQRRSRPEPAHPPESASALVAEGALMTAVVEPDLLLTVPVAAVEPGWWC
jgi:hypothetical protein